MNLIDLIFKKNIKTPKKSTSMSESLDGIQIKYKKCAFSKSVRISIKTDGTTLCTMPKNVSFKFAKEFARKNLDWIKNNMPKKPIVNKLSKEVIEKRRALAHKILPERVETLAKQYGFKYGKLAIKNHKTIWGSCSFRNNINLNLNLVALQDDFIDYVILHELTHTVHKNHQKDFYKLLTKNMPKALEVQKKLKKIKISSLREPEQQ